MTRSTKAPAGVLQPYLPLTVENYVERRLSSPAAELVYAFRSAGAGACPFAVPDGCVDLAFGIGPTDVLVTMGGTVLTAKGWDFSGEREWVGCRFRPGEAVLPAGICPADLVDADIELDPADCDGRLVDALYQASDASARMDVLTHALLSHEAARGFSTHAGSRSVRALERYVREQILAAGGAASVAALAKEAGVSTRYLRRVFVEVHGISPKQFSRFVRFQRAMGLIAREDDAAQAQALALSCGYSDQSHLVHEFDELAGVAPGKLRRMLRDSRQLTCTS
ncbi:helix-turn-helix domain-containing protein [Tractidigestivibacter montrealensis]|uniref:Helix-turn-helix domain-containing protein n=2 Tax=Atopobiaceae TaxID=1643824 RepID=A0ABT1Z7M8_9ACTN|nr:helix-turn-helix domain-containing protein [Tractidigestivibacter montrealensis]MCR9036217.1 helix-turn-helix domain-containing protein [Tractidigestivibacter montrealensis]